MVSDVGWLLLLNGCSLLLSVPWKRSSTGVSTSCPAATFITLSHAVAFVLIYCIFVSANVLAAAMSGVYVAQCSHAALAPRVAACAVQYNPRGSIAARQTPCLVHSLLLTRRGVRSCILRPAITCVRRSLRVHGSQQVSDNVELAVVLTQVNVRALLTFPPQATQLNLAD